MKRKTIKKELEIVGIGLHKGEEINMKLLPSKSGGIVFKRVDLDGNNIIKVHLNNLFDLTRGTNIKNEEDKKIHTIEHFLSALYALEITDLIIEIKGNELPIMDGSSIKFLEAIESVGIEELESEVEPIIIKEPISISIDDKHIVALPYDGYKISYTIDFDHTFLKSQYYEFDFEKNNYREDISDSRTFGFDYEIEYLKKNNLALGGTLENAIVIEKDGVMNPDGLRHDDEFVRHKILDLIGDLYVLNRPIKGHIIAIKSGHLLNSKLSEELIKL